MKSSWILVGLGGLSFSCGGLFTCMGLVQLFNPTPSQAKEEVAILTGVFGGLPMMAGAVLLSVVVVSVLLERRRLRRLGWLRGRDRFTLAELAQKQGWKVEEARPRVEAFLRAHPELDFVFHPGAGEYLRASRAVEGARVVRECASCGGRTQLVLMPGEAAACPHCGAGL